MLYAYHLSMPLYAHSMPPFIHMPSNHQGNAPITNQAVTMLPSHGQYAILPSIMQFPFLCRHFPHSKPGYIISRLLDRPRPLLFPLLFIKHVSCPFLFPEAVIHVPGLSHIPYKTILLFLYRKWTTMT